MDAVSRSLMDEDVCAASSKCACKRPRHDDKKRAEGARQSPYTAKHVRMRTLGPRRLHQPPPQK